MKCRLIYVIIVVVSFSFTEVFADNNVITTYATTSYNQNSDGYIYKGTISLTRIVSGQKETFYHFKKKGIDYVAKSKRGPYYRLARRMTIDYIDYKY